MSGTNGNGMNGNGNGLSVFRKYDAYSFRKFYFSGLIEFRYQDFSAESSYLGYKSTGGSTSFEQIYKLGMQGYIYHPRLAVFSAAVSYAKEKTDVKENPDEWESKHINYDISTTFFPTRPLSLNVYASKTSTTLGGGSYLLKSDSTSKFYGAMLLFAKNGYPNIRLEYTHWDSEIESIVEKRIRTISPEDWYYYYYYYGYYMQAYRVIRERVKEKFKTGRYSLNMAGELKFIKTRYNLAATFSKYSNPFGEHNAKSIRSSTSTRLKKKNAISTYFNYSILDTTKLLNFAANVDLTPIKSLYHSYSYEYFASERESEKTDAHTLSGSWRYRYSARIHGRANARYKFAIRDSVQENSYDLKTGINYGRPVKGFDFSSGYYFSAGKEERNGNFEFMYHDLGLGLTTRTFKPAKLYSTYDFAYRTLNFNPDIESQSSAGTIQGIEHRLRIGANGRVLGRMSWTVELEGIYSDSSDTREGEWRSAWFGDNQNAQKIRHYTVRGDLGLPFRRRGTATLRGSYTTGTTNSETVKRYYYEGRLKYRIFKSLYFTAWFREEWRNKGWYAGTVSNTIRNYDQRIRDYELVLNYYWRKINLSAQYTVTQTEEGYAKSEAKRLYLVVSRKF